MTPDPSNYHREYSPHGSYSLFQFEGTDVISVLKNSIENNPVFFKCLLHKKNSLMILHIRAISCYSMIQLVQDIDDY